GFVASPSANLDLAQQALPVSRGCSVALPAEPDANVKIDGRHGHCREDRYCQSARFLLSRLFRNIPLLNAPGEYAVTDIHGQAGSCLHAGSASGSAYQGLSLVARTRPRVDRSRCYMAGVRISGLLPGGSGLDLACPVDRCSESKPVRRAA